MFLNAETHSWYRFGIPGIGDIKQVVGYISDVANRTQASELYFVGNSMGAYGALLYGIHMTPNAVVAFDPEIKLNLTGSKSASFLKHESEFDDISTLTFSKSYVFYSELDAIDIFSASLIADKSNVSVMCVDGAMHNSPVVINRSIGGVNRLLDRLINKKDLSFSYYKQGVCTDKTLSLLILEINFLIASKELKTAYNALLDLDFNYPKIPILNNMLGYCAYKLGDYKNAKEYFDKAIDLSPYNHYAWQMCGASNFKLGNYKESFDAHQNAVLISPNTSIYLYHLGLAAEKLGDIDSAKLAYEGAYKINHNRSDYKIKYEQFCNDKNIKKD